MIRVGEWMKRLGLEWEEKNGRRSLGDGAEEQGIFLSRRVADSEIVGFVNKGELEGNFNEVRVKFDLRVGGVCINGREDES